MLKSHTHFAKKVCSIIMLTLRFLLCDLILEIKTFHKPKQERERELEISLFTSGWVLTVLNIFILFRKITFVQQKEDESILIPLILKYNNEWIGSRFVSTMI